MHLRKLYLKRTKGCGTRYEISEVSNDLNAKPDPKGNTKLQEVYFERILAYFGHKFCKFKIKGRNSIRLNFFCVKNILNSEEYVILCPVNTYLHF